MPPKLDPLMTLVYIPENTKKVVTDGTCRICGDTVILRKHWQDKAVSIAFYATDDSFNYFSNCVSIEIETCTTCKVSGLSTINTNTYAY